MGLENVPRLGPLRAVRGLFGSPAVIVDVPRLLEMIELVVFGGSLGRRGRAGDVGDRGYVVPVDAMADAEHEGGQQQPKAGGLGPRAAVQRVTSRRNQGEDELRDLHGRMLPA